MELTAHAQEAIRLELVEISVPADHIAQRNVRHRLLDDNLDRVTDLCRDLRARSDRLSGATVQVSGETLLPVPGEGNVLPAHQVDWEGMRVVEKVEILSAVNPIGRLVAS